MSFSPTRPSTRPSADPKRPSSWTSGPNGAVPCKMVAPTLAEIADEQRGKLTVAKLNVDDNPDIARRYEVMSIPTLLVFKDGQPAKRIVGAKGKGALLQDLSEFID